MAQWLNVKTALIAFGVLLIVGLGIAYAIEIQRGVGGSVIVDRVETVDETILLYREAPPSTADLTELNFGTADVTAFGFFRSLVRIPVWVKNGGDEAFRLIIKAADVGINGSPVSGDILSILLAEPGGALLPATLRGPTINSGDLRPLEVGLRLSKAPEELGIKDGDVITPWRMLE